MDLTVKFGTQGLFEKLGVIEVAGETIPLILTGNLKDKYGGTPIEGQDCAWTLKQGKKIQLLAQGFN